MRGELPSEFYREAFQHAVDALVAVDGDERVIVANMAAAKLLRITIEDAVGTRLRELWNPREREIAVTTRCALPDVRIVTLFDAAERRRGEVSSRRYELLREYTYDVILFIARDGRIVEASRSAETTYGYSRDELLALNIRDLRHESRRAELDAQFDQAFTKGTFFETVHRRRDGTPFPVEVGSRVAHIGEEDVLLSVIRDVTERRELQARLLEAARLSAFGMMAAGIAHEINNPLAYVLANAEVLARTIPELAARVDALLPLEGIGKALGECDAMLRVAMEGIERVRSIVRDLKTFSRSDPPKGVLVDLHQVLDSALNVAQGELRHRARIVRDYGDPPPVRASTSKLGQVFLNLVVNGAQAIPQSRRDGGEVRITTRTATNGWAVVEVADDGVGIPPDARARLFQAFHTTKAGEGTGLGLYISRSIVEAHGGTIEVDSEPGLGTTVRVMLPPYDPTLRVTTVHGRPAVQPSKRSRVLVVDDEPEVGIAFRALLAPTHDVAVATTVEETLALLARDAGFDAILCDVMLTDGTGMDLHARIAERHPSLRDRVILMTGGVVDGATRERAIRSGLACLDKPLTRDELVTALVALTDGTPPTREQMN